MTDERDTDGCARICRKKGHTEVWGECAYAVEPETIPQVHLMRSFISWDGLPSLGYESYTVEELAALIEPALRRVGIHLGPNATAMLMRGDPVRLSGGEYADLAREAALAIINSDWKEKS